VLHPSVRTPIHPACT